MKFQIMKSQLLELISNLQNVVAPKATIPILSNLLVEAANDELVFTATDLTVGARCFAPAKVFEEGATTLPARRLFQLVKELPEVMIEVESDPRDLTHIRAGASRFRLHGMGRDEFPGLPDLSGATQMRVPQRVLRDALGRASFAASREDNRHALTGLYLRAGGGMLTLMTTDGKRLAKMRVQVEGDSNFESAWVLPLKAVEEVMRLATDKEEEALIYLLQDRVAFELGNTTLVTKLLQGDYPNVEQVIPTKCEVEVSLHREELISLLRQVVLFTSETSQSARFQFQEGELTLSANTMDVGEGKVSMPANFSGKAIEIAFNPHFVLDVLRRSDDETCTFGLSDSYNPGVIRDTSEGVFVIMPMRLSETA